MADVEIREVDPEHPDAQQALAAYDGDVPIGCGALKHHDGESASDLWFAKTL